MVVIVLENIVNKIWWLFPICLKAIDLNFFVSFIVKNFMNSVNNALLWTIVIISCSYAFVAKTIYLALLDP